MKKLTDAKGRIVQKMIPAEGVFNFLDMPDNGFAKNYLNTYYSKGLTPDEETIIKTLIKAYPKAKAARLLELGCGPTLHHVLPAAEYFSEIHMADYLPENLQEIKLWKKKSPLAHNWNVHTEFVLRNEGKKITKNAIQKRENLLRKKLTKFLHCDFKKDLKIKDKYSAVGAFYCTEEVGVTKSEWQKVVKRLTEYVAPGGYLFMSAVRGSDYYAVVSPDGTSRHLPCANITEKDFIELLPSLGFPRDELFVQGIAQKGQEAEGIYGVVIVVAKKEIGK